MATFTSPQITSIAVMFGTNSDIMGDHLDAYEGIISEDDKTEILAQVTRYTAGTVVGRLWVEGREANFGANISVPFAASTRDPREIIAGLIQWPWAGSDQSRLQRA